MAREQLETWAQAGESETLEFKATTGERREGAHTLCAMLNHRGGRVLFGVTREGRVTGQQVSDRTIEEVAQEIRDLDPPVFPTIDRVAVAEGREVLVVTVTQGPARPYSCRGVAYRRVGNTNQVMSRDEYNRIDYHGPSVEVKPDWDLSGAIEDLRALFRVGYVVAQDPRLPQWKEGTEFMARRDSAMARAGDR